MTTWPPEAPTALPVGETKTKDLHPLLHRQTSTSLVAILAELGGSATNRPRGAAASVVERLALGDAEVARLRNQVNEVYEVLSEAAEGSNGDLLNRINNLRNDLTAVDQVLAGRLTTLETRRRQVDTALGDLSVLLAGYGDLGARLAAQNPAPAILATWDGTGTFLNTSPARLHGVPVPSPGYPYRLQVSGQCRIGSADPDGAPSEWNLNITAQGGGQSSEYFIGVAAQPTDDPKVKLLRWDFPVQDRVHTGDCSVFVTGVRARGSGRGEHNPTNRELRVARWRA